MIRPNRLAAFLRHRAAALSAAALFATPCVAADDGLAATPPMGWSSWSLLRMNVGTAPIESQAAAIASSGLAALGYVYVNVDDGWYLDPRSTVDAYGRWSVDTSKFPGGIAQLARYVHGQGLKLGWYLTPGIPVAAYAQDTPIKGTAFHARDIVSDTTDHEANYNYSDSMYYIDWNRNAAAAQAYLDAWARQLAGWGVDYIKLDGVGTWDEADVQGWYTAIAHSGRAMHLELSNSLDAGSGNTWRHVANGWRIDGDIECYCSTVTDWNHVASRFADAPRWTQFAGPGGWNDLDSIEPASGLTHDERQTQVTLWAVNAAPLLLGLDVTTLTADDRAVIANPEVIAIDQAGSPAHPLGSGSQQAWSAWLPDGTFAVALFNLDGQAAAASVSWSQLGFSGPAAVRDTWAHAELGSFQAGFSATLPAHGSRLLKVTPPAGTTPPTWLVSPATSRCLTAPASAGQVVISDCVSARTDSQLATFGSDGTLRIAGLCLDVYGQSTQQNAEVGTWTCNGQDNQKWRLNADGSFTGVQSGLCLDVSGGLTDSGNGTPLITWPCHGGDNQKWLRR